MAQDESAGLKVYNHIAGLLEKYEPVPVSQESPPEMRDPPEGHVSALYFSRSAKRCVALRGAAFSLDNLLKNCRAQCKLRDCQFLKCPNLPFCR